MLFLATGAVYGWGSNHFGQLGLGDNVDRYDARLIRIPNTHSVNSKEDSADSSVQIVSIACGGFHSAFVAALGELYMCGWGKSGQLGLGDSNSRSIPLRVTSLVGMNVSMVACAGRYTVCVTDHFIKVHNDYFAEAERIR